MVAHLSKANGVAATPTELLLAQSLTDLEKSVPDLKKDLRPIQISAAKEIEVGQGKKAIAVFVPVPLLKQTRRVQQRVTRELEKKFSDSNVVFIAERRILPRPTRKSRQKQSRPRSRTLTAVYEKILEDLVYPSEIVGKRTRVKVDGSRTTKCFLSSKDATNVGYKLDTFSTVYKQLTGKDVVFEFDQDQAL
ncbi:40S ribosomal protein S7 [Zancudomyces culisetae]|uniref:40S ribosomal protein S7 n=1 Tax=Zancudomyces culisetae TaxID=1213189 RepID=A0A1R1PGZ5_ZANCU|nr:40S ribosomal protein S7 [Zancudomyces culisetae]|eukprot:OMH80275.1 40S ribosomal protein S7 [Zancudomyces culisetae]